MSGNKRAAEQAAACFNSKRARAVPTTKEAVERIQRAYRRTLSKVRTISMVEDYFAHGPTIEHVQSISFEALVVLLREKPIISVTKACLQRIHLLSIFMHGSPSLTLAPENVNVRVFLAAFMIAYRPTHVFESMGALEQALVEAATPLLAQFEAICNAIRNSKGKCFSDIPRELTKDFPAMLFEYLKRFKAWKVPDEAKLTCRIKHALIALYQAEEHLPPDEPEDSKLKLEFRSQIERLRGKMKQIAGDEELAKFDEQRNVGQTSGAHSGGDVQKRVDGASSSGGAYAALPGRMTNEQLAHELLLDPTFQLDENGGCSVDNPVFHRIRESFHQAFWDSLVDDLKLASPCYVRVLRVLAEIRDGIRDLAGTRETGNIDDVVDVEFIKQQAEKGLYGWENSMRLLSAIVEVVQRVQAPKRDDETKAKWKNVLRALEEADLSEQPRAFCKGLEFLLDRVNAMRIDAANARLRLIAPVIKDHGVDYERGKLQDKLNDGSITLARTQEWIARTVKREVAADRVKLQELVDGKAPAFVRIHSAGMVSLIADGEVPRVQNCPETLLFDVHRLSLLQSEYRYIVVAATLLTTISHNVQANSINKPADAQVLATISEQFVSESRREIDVEHTVGDVMKSLERSSLSTAVKEKIGRGMVQGAAPTDAVQQLMGSRIRTLVEQIATEGKLPDEIKLVSAVKCLVPRIDKMATKLRNVIVLNRNVHIPHYNRMIQEEAERLRVMIQS